MPSAPIGRGFASVMGSAGNIVTTGVLQSVDRLRPHTSPVAARQFSSTTNGAIEHVTATAGDDVLVNINGTDLRTGLWLISGSAGPIGGDETSVLFGYLSDTYGNRLGPTVYGEPGTGTATLYVPAQTWVANGADPGVRLNAGYSSGTAIDGINLTIDAYRWNPNP